MNLKMALWLGLAALGVWVGVLLSRAPDQSPALYRGEEGSRTPSARTPGMAMGVEHDCQELWLEDQVRCIFHPDRRLQLWIKHERPSDVEILVSGRMVEGLEPKRSDVDEGRGFRVDLLLPADARLVEVRARGSSARPWSLPLVLEGSEPRPEGVPTSSEVVEAFSEVFDECAAGDYRAAERTLEEIEPFALRFPRGRADLATVRGIVQWYQRKLPDAASSLREGVVFATRFDDEVLFEEAVPMYAAILAELGYLESAEFWAKRALKALSSPCPDTARLRSTLGWVGVMQAMQRGQALGETRDWLEQGLSLLATECPSDDILPGLALSMALLDLHEGKPLDALSRLEKVEYARVSNRDEELRLRDARVQALLALRRLNEAASALAELQEVVEQGGGPEGRWRIALRQGELHHAKGQSAEAVAAYYEAEREVRSLMALAALGVGRQTTAFLHLQSNQHLVSLLVEQGRVDQALCAARESQARRLPASDISRRPKLKAIIDRYRAVSEEVERLYDAFRRGTVSEQEELGLPIDELELEREELVAQMSSVAAVTPTCDELTPRSADELVLGLHPAGREWLVFVQDSRGIDVLRVEPSVASLAQVVDRFGDRVEGARRVKVLASGEAQDVDVHLLSWRGAALAQRVPVVYGAELPRSTRPAAAPGARPRVLLVADPTETLLMAVPEVTLVRYVLTALGWAIDAPDPSTVDDTTMREMLPLGSFFYYAGHGEHEGGSGHVGMLPPYAGGTKAWRSRLRLLPPAVFETHEIQMLDAVPRHVALIGCETGVPDYAGGTSLALAFLLAGAEEVVATPDETDDLVGANTGFRLLLGASTSGIDLGVGLHRAQKDLLERGMEVGRYRVWVR